MRVIDAIIQSLHNLGGQSDLEDIYIEVNKVRATPNPSIRARLYEHASECDAYKKTNPDLFESTDGKGGGTWRFRTKNKSIPGPSTWLDEIIDIKKFEIGALYKKKDIRLISGLSKSNGPREPWTGIVRLANAVLLFVNLDKTDADESLKFKDFFDGSDFFWESRNSDSIETTYIKEMLDGIPVYLFCRISKKGDFVYVGELNAVNYDDTVSPMQFQFELIDFQENPNENLQLLYKWKPNDVVRVPKISTSKPQKNRKSSQGFIKDSKKKVLIELHAMKVAYEHYSDNGYEIEDCSGLRNLGYDYRCKKGNELIEVEVKGTTTHGNSVILTRNEVDNAKTTQNRADLFIVHSMDILVNDGDYDVISHKVNIIENWTPIDSSLEALTYSYKVD